MDCPSFPELSLSEWGEALMAPVGGKRYPIGGTMELTERCNLACLHCYINQPAGSRAARSRELSTGQVSGILDQLAEAGTLFLLLTGGEIFLRSDFPEIYRYARQRGILLNLFTNATLLTPQLADLLAESRPRSIEVTMYGATQETYESVTRVPGSYARFRRGIELMLERKLPLFLKSVLMTRNLHELAEMRAFAESLGLVLRYDGLLWPRLDGNRGPSEYQITLEDLVSLDSGDPERQKAWDEIARLCEGHQVRNEYIYSCGAGIRSFNIDSFGKMSICTMSREPSFDLSRMGFKKAWEKLGELRTIRRQLDTPCRTCTIGGLCTQCPGWSQVMYNDNETPVKLVCDLAHLRADKIRNLAYNPLKEERIYG